MPEDLEDRLLQGLPHAEGGAAQEVVQAGEQRRVVGEDHLLLPAEVAEEAGPAHAGLAGELVGRDGVVALAVQQVDQGGEGVLGGRRHAGHGATGAERR